MAAAFSDSFNGIWGRWVHPPPKISGTTKGMTMKFLPDVGIHKEARNQKKNFDLTGPVCKLQTKILKNTIFGNATFGHANFTKFCRIVTIDVRNKPWKFQIDISKIGYFTEQSVKCRKSWSVKYRTAHKIQSRSRDFTKFTGWCHVIHI